MKYYFNAKYISYLDTAAFCLHWQIIMPQPWSFSAMDSDIQDT